CFTSARLNTVAVQPVGRSSVSQCEEASIHLAICGPINFLSTNNRKPPTKSTGMSGQQALSARTGCAADATASASTIAQWAFARRGTPIQAVGGKWAKIARNVKAAAPSIQIA